MTGEFARKALAGFVIGIGCVVPGVSGGLMAVSFGLYRPMLDALIGYFKDVRGNTRFLLPLAVGGAVGFVLGALALERLMSLCQTAMLFLFIGFILGGVPGVVLQANEKGFKPRYLLALLGGLGASLLMTALPQTGAQGQALNTAQSLLTGAIQGVSTVVPGVSGSFLLIYLGWYQPYLDAVSSLRLAPLMLMAAGFALAALVSMRGVKWLFDSVPAYAHYAVLGFLLGSTLLIVPPFSAGWTLAAELAAFALGLAGALWMNRLETGRRV